MKVEIIRSTTLQAVNSQGAFSRAFAAGDLVDVDEMQARIWFAQQVAVHPRGRATIQPVESPKAKPKAKR